MHKEPPKALIEAVNAYKNYLERLSLRRVALISKHMQDGVSFKDPFYMQATLDQRKQLLQILCASSDNLKISISDILYSTTNEAMVYFKWHVQLHKDMAGLEGMSELIFDHNYKIAAQDDYWDSASTIWAAHPLMRWLFKKGRKRIFGH